MILYYVSPMGKRGWNIQTYNGMQTLRSRGVTNNSNIIPLKRISTHYLILLSDTHSEREKQKYLVHRHPLLYSEQASMVAYPTKRTRRKSYNRSQWFDISPTIARRGDRSVSESVHHVHREMYNIICLLNIRIQSPCRRDIWSKHIICIV